MTKRMIALVLLVVMTVSLLAACGKSKSEYISTQEAQKIAGEYLGVSRKDVKDIHPHSEMINDVPHYNIHMTLNDGTEYNVLINALTGKVVESK